MYQTLSYLFNSKLLKFLLTSSYLYPRILFPSCKNCSYLVPILCLIRKLIIRSIKTFYSPFFCMLSCLKHHNNNVFICFPVMDRFRMILSPGNRTPTSPQGRCRWLQQCGVWLIRHKVRYPSILKQPLGFLCFIVQTWAINSRFMSMIFVKPVHFCW